jgi:hypothetical protein
MVSDFNFNIWYDSYDPSFIEISKKSFVPEKWLTYQNIDHDKFSSSFIKPINKYAQKLYPKPELVSIHQGLVRLRQRNHAEILLLDKAKNYKNLFRNIDRPHVRQYYQTRIEYPESKECFDPAYIFYTPWFLDENISVLFEQPEEDSPVKVYQTSASFKKQPAESFYVEPKFVPFRFKKVGPHMSSENMGKIKRGSAIFDIVFQADDILIERVRDFYEKN